MNYLKLFKLKFINNKNNNKNDDEKNINNLKSLEN